MTKLLQELYLSKDCESIERWEATILQKHLGEARQEAKQLLE